MAYSDNATATARMSQVQNDTMEQLSKGKEADEKDGGIMREIKFRAWDRGCKMMIAPFDIRTLIKAFNDESNDAEYADHPVYQHLGYTGDAEGYDLMQFTGLKDKNGVDIYEGDVVRMQGKKRIGQYVTEVIFKAPIFRPVRNDTYFVDWAALVGCEVIGNIFENPELLEDK